MTVHDLPPRWDGFTVEWQPRWQTAPTSLSLHLDDLGACEECGSVAWSLTRFGQYLELGAQQTERLIASRCQDCEHTTITEAGTSQTWDIDASDLTDQGSYDDTTKQLTLF